MEQRPETGRKLLILDGLLPDDENPGQILAVTVTVEYPEGRGLDAAGVLQCIVRERMGEVVAEVLKDPGTKARVLAAYLGEGGGRGGA